MRRLLPLGIPLLLTVVALGAAQACGGSDPQPFGDDTDGGAGSDAFGPLLQGDGQTVPAGCKGLECKKVSCPNGGTTSISGTVVAPTPAQYGKADPIYNAIVYVPNGTVAPFTAGVSCDKCGAPVSGEPVSITLTGFDGKFQLDDVPVADDLPLVIQIGRWRRQIKVPKVAQCADTPLTADDTRLPRDHTEGDIPQMAVVTSLYDPTECILRKIGVADSEFTDPTGTGRVHLYKGNGSFASGSTPTGDGLWGTGAQLAKYDLIALPCYSYPTSGTATQDKQNIFDYASLGGRVFVTDLSFPVISQGPAPWPSTANWTPTGSFTNPGLIDTSFPKGDALAKWLQAIGATTTAGQINITNTYNRFSAANPPAQRWIYSSQTTQTYAFNTPVGVDPKDQCGRVAYSSFHIANSATPSTFPAECTAAALTPQEKVLEFMLFDLSSCVQKDSEPPKPPPK